jgi:hypothetical protein
MVGVRVRYAEDLLQIVAVSMPPLVTHSSSDRHLLMDIVDTAHTETHTDLCSYQANMVEHTSWSFPLFSQLSKELRLLI